MDDLTEQQQREAVRLDLSDEQRRVFETLSRMEARGVDAARPDEIASEADLEREQVRATITSLVHLDLVEELPPAEPDLGPRYRLEDNVSPVRGTDRQT